MTILVRKVASKGWLKNTKRFKAISSFSPILSPSQVPWWIKAFATYLGENQTSQKEWNASKLVKEIGIPSILITQGTEDGFYPEQLTEAFFLKNTQENNVSVDYKKEEGYDHSYFFIATFFEEHFGFHIAYLR